MSNHHPLVSVIVPTYNRAHLIRRTVDSILGQSYRHFELLVVNDGGSDHTPQAIANVHDERLRYLTQRHAGQAAARNAGLQLARGEYVAFCDDDDVWLDRKLEAQIQFLRDHPLVDVCYTGSTIRAQGRDVAYYFQPITGDPLPLLLFVNPATTPAYLVRRSCFQKVGWFDTATPALEDHLMWLRLAKYYTFGGIDEPLVIIYRQPQGQGGNYRQNILHSNRALLRELEAIKRDLPGRISTRLEKKIIAYATFKSAKAELAGNRRWPALRCCVRSISLNPQNFEAWLLLPFCLLGEKFFTPLGPWLQQRRGRLPNLPKGIPELHPLNR